MQALLWKYDLSHILDWQWWCNVLWLHFVLGPGLAGSEPICQAGPTVFALKLQFYFDQQLNVERWIFFYKRQETLYIEICAYFFFSFEFKVEINSCLVSKQASIAMVLYIKLCDMRWLSSTIDTQLKCNCTNKYLFDIENVLNFSNFLNSFSAVCCGPVSAKELSTQALQGVLPGVRKSCSGLVKLPATGTNIPRFTSTTRLILGPRPNYSRRNKLHLKV